MDMSKFSVISAHSVDIPTISYKNFGADKEIKVLEKKIKDTERNLHEGKEVSANDRDELNTNRVRVLYLEEVKELKKRKSEAEKKAKEAKKESGDDEEKSEYDILLDYEKAELKTLEEKGYKEPLPEKELKKMEFAMWKFFLPISYSNASFSEKKLSDLPHTLPYDLLKEWTDIKNLHAFTDFEIRTSRTDAYLQYFALFGFRGPKCWLIAEWVGSQIHKTLSPEEKKRHCIHQMDGLQCARKIRIIAAIIAVGLSVISLWMGNSLFSIFFAGICIAICASWKTLETGFSLKEENDLLVYLKTP